MEYRLWVTCLQLFHNWQVLKHPSKFVKKLAIIKKDVADVGVKRFSWLQNELMKEERVLETTHETKIINQCNLEGQKMKVLQSSYIL